MRDAPHVQGRPGVNTTRRNAIVTGAASGIGHAITTRLVDDGHNVLAVDLERPDTRGIPFTADLVTREGNLMAVDAALERFAALDTVIACAGLQHVASVPEFPEDRWDQLLAVMLTSPFLLAKYSWPHLTRSGAGRFIAIGSAHSLVASPFKAAYVSAKHGVNGLVKTLALEGAADELVAITVCPGFVDTPLVHRQVRDLARTRSMPEHEVLDQLVLAPQAVKRMLEPGRSRKRRRLLAHRRRTSVHGVERQHRPRLDREVGRVPSHSSAVVHRARPSVRP